MKLIITLIFFSITTLNAQVVVTIPEFATENDSIKIIFDATQGDGGLQGYFGTVYAHTGVITNYSSSSTDWKHVIGDWGNNSNQPALTNIGPDLYELVIGYPREFYSVTDPNEHILKLAFVFRSANSQLTGRDVGGADIFAPLYEPGLNIVLNDLNVQVNYGDPLRSPLFSAQEDTITISASVVQIDDTLSSIIMFINQVQVAQTSDTILVYDFIGSQNQTGANDVQIIAESSSGNNDTTDFIIFVNPAVVNAPLPAGLEHGINYIDNSTVILALLAPYKEFVYVLGDFNDWFVDTAYFMNRYEVNPDSVIWWKTISGLTPQEEYAFQYLVDGYLRIGDPYTHKVLDPWNDEFISPATYPDLKEYPKGKTSEPVAILQTDQQPYQWQITNFQKPPKEDLVIYELLLRDFLTSHDFDTLLDTLNYLKNLGINAIELMPVMEFEGNISWGYNPSFHLALDKYYGPDYQLKALIDSAHSMGIAVILDMVLNHAFGQNPMVRLYWDSDNNRPAENNLWFNPVPKHDFNVGYDFNHESTATKYYVDRVNAYWLSEFKFDGFRFDLSKGFTQTNTLGNTQQWGEYDQSRIDILERMANKLWEVDPDAYVILEHFAENDEEIVLSDFGMMLWGNMNYEYNEATMGYQSDLTWGSYFARGWDDPHLVSYMESHDEERLMYKNMQYGNSGGNYNIRNFAIALNRIKLAAAFFFTIPGPKMIWQFGELGYDFSINYPCGTDACRLDPKPIRWDYFSDPLRIKLYKVFKELINLKKNYDVFKTKDFTASLGNYAKRIELNDSSMDARIIGNFNVVSLSYNPNFSQTGWWYDFFSGDSLFVTNTTELIPLEPGEFHIYTTKRLPVPEPGLLTDVETLESGIVTEFGLEQNYPNPFNPSTQIIFHVAEAGPVKLKIFDMLGSEIITLIDDFRNSGSYKADWDGRNHSGVQVSSGIYLYRLEAPGFIQTRKMILLR
ncbi:MAG: hypothetical protein Kow0098_24520 [Ignavibacteriaceae bacterium]